MFKLLKLFFLSATFCLILNANDTFAQQLIYQPVNPSFGGSPLNGSWLLNSAQLQDSNTDPNATTQTSQNPLENFKDQLSRNILNQLSRDLVDNLFGEGGVQPGKFEIGDFIIDITETFEGLNIVIFDIITGDETTIFIPFI